MGLTLVNILAGLFAPVGERGKLFGILAVMGPLGALIGGIATGLMADAWGYPAMFTCLAALWACEPLAGLFLEDKVVQPQTQADRQWREAKPGLGSAFYFLLLASTAAGVAAFVALMGRSLLMDGLGFSATAIASTGAVSGAVGLPLPFVTGWLSDRVDRKPLLAVCYIAAAAGLVLLTGSTSLWHFWVVFSLIGVTTSVNVAVGSAFVTDLVAPEALGRGMSLFNATMWIGGVIGFGATGYSFERLGATETFIGAAVLAVVSVLLLALIQPEKHGSPEPA
jgi:MFS family permease